MQTKLLEEGTVSREEMLVFIEKQAPEMAEKLKKIVDKEEFLKDKNVYGELYSNRQIGICFDRIFQAEYLRCRILETVKDSALSAKQIAEIIGKKPGEILREVVELRRKNLVAIEKIDDQTPLYRVV